MLIKLAFRNVVRNARRTAMTVLAIAVGGAGLVMFGGFVAFIRVGLETTAVQRLGHLSIFRAGYFDFGSANPTAFGLTEYAELLRLVRHDPTIGPKVRLATPFVTLTGIAANFTANTSKTFLGSGYVPAERDRMFRWDEHAILHGRTLHSSGLSERDETLGVVGVGLARALGLCEALKLHDCPQEALLLPDAINADAQETPPELAALAESEHIGASAVEVTCGHGEPCLELLAATANGAPNVLTLRVGRSEPQGARALDETFVAMHFSHAQKLLYGRGEKKAVGVLVQLFHTEDISLVRSQLATLFEQHGFRLELKDFREMDPLYLQAVGMFRTIFLFISAIIGLVVSFTVINTVGMSVLERTSEIGTLRAMGVRRKGVRRLFLLEGMLLGMFGATIGLVFGTIGALIFNSLGAQWTPPGQAAPVPLEVMTSGMIKPLAYEWMALVLVAAMAALVPARRAARLQVVDALRRA